MVYPNGLAVTFAYDAAGLLSQVGSNIANWSTLANSFQFQPATNERLMWKFGSGQWRSFLTDADKRLNLIWSWGAQYTEIGYNNVDNITSLINHVFPVERSSFVYNAQDRLQTVTRSGDAQVFGTDGLGNRTTHVRNGSSFNYTLDSTSNRLAAITGATARNYSYDALGSLTSENGPGINRSYGYDGFNRLRTVHQAGLWVGHYESNALNQRV
jgi:YD repeat-containing protein